MLLSVARRTMATARHTKQLRPEAVAMLRRARSDPATQSCMLVGLVEEIHDVDGYTEYAQINSTIFHPYASTFTVVARSMTADMDHFLSLGCTASLGTAPVARVPFVCCTGVGILSWLLSDEYLEENLVCDPVSSSPARRHRTYRLAGAATPRLGP